MKRLGISIYLNQPMEDIKNYIKLASKYGFSRIFTCLLSVGEDDIQSVIKNFKEVLSVANERNMEVIADIDPTIFKNLNLSINDLGFFKEIGLSGIRLDLGFSGLEESRMTYNEHDLKVEINMSNGTKYVDNIISHSPNKDNLYGCHNFYPHIYTGLSLEHFNRCSKQFKDLGIKTAAFVNSPSAGNGPWPVSEGLCTLEMHRDLPIEVQAKHLFATGLIDDVIIANCFASEEELKALSKVSKSKIVFNVNLYNKIPELEKKIVLEEPHFNRGDVSEYMLRSTQSRVKYKGHDFKVFNTPDIKRGDILIDSNFYTRYAGELQVALKDMKNSGKTNVVGRICEEEIFLLDYIEPWMSFGFKVKD